MSADAALDAIAQRRSQSLTGLVRDELERMILSGELKAGERLNELALASRLGVSRGPVREAARTLERDGLVTCIAHQGVFVRQLSIEEAAELYDLRAVIVGYACGRAAQQVTPDEMAELGTLLRQMDEAAAAEDADAYYGLNLGFHDRLMEISGRGRSAELYQSLVKEAHLYRRRSLMSPEAMRASNAEHRAIFERIAAWRRGGSARRGRAAPSERQAPLARDAAIGGRRSQRRGPLAARNQQREETR